MKDKIKFIAYRADINKTTKLIERTYKKLLIGYCEENWTKKSFFEHCLQKFQCNIVIEYLPFSR